MSGSVFLGLVGVVLAELVDLVEQSLRLSDALCERAAQELLGTVVVALDECEHAARVGSLGAVAGFRQILLGVGDVAALHGGVCRVEVGDGIIGIKADCHFIDLVELGRTGLEGGGGKYAYSSGE